MKILIFAGFSKSLIHFRKELLLEIKSKGNEVIAIGPEADYQDALNDLGIQFKQIKFNRLGINPFKDLRLILSLISYMKSEKFDLYFGYTIKPVIYGSIAAALSKVPYRYSMITGLGSVFIDNEKSLIRFLVETLYKIGLFCSTAVIFQNNDDLEQFYGMNLVKKNQCYLVNGSGVNLDYYKEAPLPKKDSFLFVGSLLINKGIREYLKAAEHVKKQYPNVVFGIAGPLDQRLTAITQEELDYYIKEKIVNYYGEVNDVRPYLEQCRVFVLPSYREGTPRSILEAMAVGRAIITTDVPGCRDTVCNMQNGLLISSHKYQELAEAMVWMIENPLEVERMAGKSLEIARDKYDVHKVNETMIKIMGI